MQLQCRWGIVTTELAELTPDLADVSTAVQTSDARTLLGWHKSRQVVLDLVLALLGLVAISLVAGNTGYFSADEMVAHEQVDFLSQGEWLAPVPEPVIDPAGRWHPLMGVSLGDGVVAPYAKHRTFPSMLRLGDTFFGRQGRFIVVSIAAVLAAFLVSLAAENRRVGAGRVTFWMTMLGTPVLFHGLVLWAHAIAIACAALVWLLLQRLLGPGAKPSHIVRPTTLLVVAGATMLGTLVRTDAAIAFLIMGVVTAGFGLLGLRQGQIRADLIIFGIAVTATSFGTMLFDDWLRTSLLGAATSEVVHVPDEARFDMSIRFGLLKTWVVGSPSGLGVARLAGLVLLLAAAIRSRPGHEGTLSPAVGIAGGLLYLVATFSGHTMAFAVAAPALAVGFAVLTKWDTMARIVVVSSVLVFGAVVATSYANAGGGDWGGRYLSMLIAPLAIVAGPGIADLWADPDRRKIGIGVALASLSIAAGMGYSVIRGRDITTEIAVVLQAELTEFETGEEPVVITDARYGRLLGEWDDNSFRLFQVPAEDMEEFSTALGEQQTVVALNYPDEFEAPREWTEIGRSKHLVRYQTSS